MHCGKKYFCSRVGFCTGNGQVQRVDVQLVVGKQYAGLGDFAGRNARDGKILQGRFGAYALIRIAAVMREQAGQARA